MTKSNFAYYDGVTISQTQASYKVELLEEEWTIYVSTENVRRVSKETKQDENLVALLLAYIYYIRRDTMAAKNKIQSINEEVLLESVIKLLSQAIIESRITQVKELKWHELREVLESENPVATLDEIT